MTNKHAIRKQLTTYNSLFTNFAFTLAETLIVMGIIGVVAALTLPNLNSSTGDKEKVAKVKKAYSNIEDALGRVQAVYGNFESCPRYKFYGRMFEFMKGQEGTSVKCQNWISSNPYVMPFLLSDGMCLLIDFAPSEAGVYTSNLGDAIVCNGGYSNSYTTDYCAIVAYIDIDGTNKGKNAMGKDRFEFFLTKNGFVPAGSPLDTLGKTDALLKSNCFTTGVGCTAWVIQNDNMDYLKATKGACNSGSVNLSWTNTTCK